MTRSERGSHRSAALALGAALALLAAPGRAELSLGVGVESFAWTESTSPQVRERGYMPSFWIHAVQPSKDPWRFAYRGKLYAGSVHYEGAQLDPPNAPLSGTTSYSGMSHELELHYLGAPDAGPRLSWMISVGYEAWNRKLTSEQEEDYRVGFARAGVGIYGTGAGTWLFAAGLKYPFYVSEDAHLNAIGFDQNPRLEPGGKPTYYARLGYRITGELRIVAYTDGYEFGQSPAQRVTQGGVAYLVYQPASTLRVYGILLERDFQ